MNLRVVLFAFPLAVVVGAVLERFLSRRSSAEQGRRAVSWAVDAGVIFFLVVAGCLYVNHLHNVGNPYWIPEGQDWREFLSAALEIKTPRQAAPVANRYPFYPWLGVVVAGFQDVPVYVGCMQVSIVAAGVIPAGLYLLGRQVAPLPVAFAAALLGIHGRTLLAMLGPPTDYILYTSLEVWVLATGVLALRRGGWHRFLAFGVALALIMATAAKALVVLTVAIPFALGGLAWRIVTRPWHGLLESVAFFLPLVAVWGVYSQVSWPMLPLERIVLTSQESVADERGYRVEFPDDLGWQENDPYRHGYWRVGSWDALRHLPDTYRFLLRGAKGNAPWGERCASVVGGLGRELSIPSPAFILLALPACLAPWFRRERGLGLRVIPGAVPALFFLGLVVTEFVGLTSNLFVPRYALNLLVLLPTLMVLGVVALFRLPVGHRETGAGWTWWLPAVVVLLWMALGDGRLGRPDVDTFLRGMAAERSESKYMDLKRLGRLSQRLSVVDLTGTRLLPDLLPDALVRHLTWSTDSQRLVVPAAKVEKRFLVQPCQFAQVSGVPRWAPHDPARIRPFGTCVDEDLDPSRSIELVPFRGTPHAVGNATPDGDL